MQEYIAKNLRISILIWLLLLALAFSYLIYYEQQHDFQWEEMVQPHWEQVENSVSADVAEAKNLEAIALGNPVEQTASEKTADQNIQEPVMPAPVTSTTVASTTVKSAVVKPAINKQVKRSSSQKKNSKLHFKLPEDLYHDQTAEWHEKKPVVIPDLFAPKKETPSRVQLGGRLIIDDDKKKQQPDADYFDTVKGAEVNISISTQ